MFIFTILSIYKSEFFYKIIYDLRYKLLVVMRTNTVA